MALAGGATLTFPQQQGYLHTDDSILSPDGTCRTFDANARGTIFGDGVGAVLLKRLDAAIADQDEIYAVIRGWGVSNDGADKGGYTAPSIDGQAAAITQAHRRAGIGADSIGYVEAHGTGTLVGDPIEVAALTKAFRETTDKTGYCRLASLKSNVGHLDVAAGVAGLIKTSLCLKHRLLPPLLHFESPNPKIDFANSPFIVNDRLHEWNADELPRRAGVSSFGVGGTNAHIVLEEAPELPRRQVSKKPRQVITLSAQSQESLDEEARNLASFLNENPNANLGDVCATLSSGRKAMPLRRAIVAQDLSQAIDELQQKRAAKTKVNATRGSSAPEIVYMFPGQGSQHFGMGRQLYDSEPIYAESFEQCNEALKEHLECDLRQLVLFDDTKTERLNETKYAQPAIFMVSYALARWLESLGIRPALMMGHSVGEFACAAIAGVMSLDDAARLVAMRGRLMQELPPGGMLAVRAPAVQVQTLLDKNRSELEIAAHNAPEMCVVSGELNQIEQFADDLESGSFGDPIAATRLRTSHAFHSRMMDPAVESFRNVVRQVKLAAPQIPMLSTVTARLLDIAQATDTEYWARQIREPVQFSDSLGNLINNPDRGNTIFLEVGPNQALSSLTRLQGLDTKKALRHLLLAPCQAIGRCPQPRTHCGRRSVDGGRQRQLAANGRSILPKNPSAYVSL